MSYCPERAKRDKGCETEKLQAQKEDTSDGICLCPVLRGQPLMCYVSFKEFGDEGPTADSEESNKIKHLRFSLKAFIFGCAGSLLLCTGSLVVASEPTL